MSYASSRILLVVGLVLAVATGVLLYEATRDGSRSARAAAPETDRAPTVVARVDIPQGAAITAEMLESRAFPAELLPSGAIVDATAVVGRRAAAALPKGMPVTQRHLAGGKAATEAAVQDGRVLVIHPTADALTAAGLVQPGDRIDVLATITAGGERVTQVVVQDLEVLQVIGGSREQPARALTFRTEAQTALVLKYLRDSGAALDLVLRGSGASPSTRPVDARYVVSTLGLRP